MSEIILSKVKDLITGTASPHLNVGDVKSFEILVIVFSCLII